MAGLRHRFGPQRGVSSGSMNPLGGAGTNFPRPTSVFSRPMRGMGANFRIPGVSFRVFPRMKMVTFDRSIIKKNWKAINRNPMQRAGNLIRIIARGSIRRVSRYAPPSVAPAPPRSRFGASKKKAARGKGTPPFKMIYNVPTMMGTGQVIGMVGFGLNMGAELPVPGLHEHGGTAVRSIRDPRRRRRAQSRNSRGQFQSKPGNKYVRRRVRYPKRPFMVPALKKARPKLSQLWRNSLARSSHKGLQGM